MKYLYLVFIFSYIGTSLSYGQLDDWESGKKHELTFNSSVWANSITGDDKSIVVLGFGVEYGFFLKHISLRTNPTFGIIDQGFFSIPIHIGHRFFDAEQVFDYGFDLEINAGPNFCFFNTNRDLKYNKIIATRKNGLFGDLEAKISTEINKAFVSMVIGYSRLLTENFRIHDSLYDIYGDERINKNFFKISFNVGYRF